jgi:5-methylcytosine-specific restriction endonuclease McrA
MLPRGRFRVAAGKRRSQCRECEKPSRAAVAARRRKRVVGSYRAADVRALLVAQGWQCASPGCRRHLTVYGYHVDHIVSIARGGSNTRENIQLLCPRCNLRKGSK